MAQRIIDAGLPTTLWARRPATLDPFRDGPADVAADPAALGAASEIVCLCVFGDDDVRGVVAGDRGLLAGMDRGSIIVIHSTVHPATVTEIADLAAPSGVELLDAPVSGGGAAAAARQLCVMVGGTEAAFARARIVFETYGDPVRRVGPLGSGTATKLVNNLLFMAHIGLADEALGIVRALGGDPAMAGQILNVASASSFGLGVLLRSEGGRREFLQRAGSVLAKDLSIITDLLDGLAVPLGALGAAASSALAPPG